MQLRFESYVFEYLEDVGIVIFDRVFGAVQYRFIKDGSAVNIEDNREVIFTAEVWYNELTCLISAYFSSEGLTINVSVMSKKTWCFFE